jgi:glycosyltransferase involved in cell wall biosynthesis
MFCSLTESFILKSQINSKIFTFSEKDSNLLLEKYNLNSSVTSFYVDNNNNFEIEEVFNRIVLFGSWKRPENYQGLKWFIDNIQPKLNLGIEILVIGGGLDNKMIESISKIKAIKYLGFVKDPNRLISESNFLIAPVFQGAGVKVKVIDSLSLGTAVIGTDLAFEGVSSIYSDFMVLANNADDFVQNINNQIFSKIEKNEFKSFFRSTYFNHSIAEYIKI